MKTISIQFKSGESHYSRDVPLDFILKLNTSFVDLTNYFKTEAESVLIQLNHDQLISSLNVSEVSSYVLLFFDDDLIYKGVSYSSTSTSGSFVIQTQYKIILL